MERSRNTTETTRTNEQNAACTHEIADEGIRRLAELELMLVGGGDGNTDWGG